jgi:hypothetical protein
MRTLTLLLALFLLAAPASASAAKKDERRAKKMLADKVFIRFTETGSIGNESSLDQRLHLCRSGDYVYDSVSYVQGVSVAAQRYTGTWKVVSAKVRKNGTGRARVRGRPDDGSDPTTVKITWDGSVTRLDGLEVIVERSDLC